MSADQELEVDRLRIKFPRSYKALVQLYPRAWDGILQAVEPAMEEGKTASVIAGRQSIFRGLDRSTRRWLVLCFAADRREIVLRGQRSFLTQLHDKSLDDILAELNSLETQHGGAVREPPHDNNPRGFVFVSHHRRTGGALAGEIVSGLEAAGQQCWVAPRDARDGFDWNEEVYSAAQRCGAMVLLLNDDARKSRAVRGEVHIAVGRDVPIFVVKLADIDPAILNVGLGTYQHIEWQGQALADAPDLVKRLARSLNGSKAA